MSEQSSPTSPTVLAFFDPESSSWRTSQGCLLSAVPESLERLPAWGTTSGGVLYELQTPAHLTAVRDGSASLPTPRSFMANMADRPLKIRDVYKSNLEEAIALLPTPVVNDMGAGKTVEAWDTWTDEMKAKHGNSNGHGPSLSIEVARLLPTPRAQNGEPRNMKPWVRPLDQPQNLENAIARLLPTPTGRDHKGRNQRNDETCLPGAVLALPSLDGSESSTGPHPHPPTTGGSPADSSSG